MKIATCASAINSKYTVFYVLMKEAFKTENTCDSLAVKYFVENSHICLTMGVRSCVKYLEEHNHMHCTTNGNIARSSGDESQNY